ncbi:ATP-binding protein [Nonomuraea wenchangensis]|uniref:AAA ATPase domain-containing protein n=1 Tax=Nonomuraea wenchangensis TaxID=568860 RepID=A0A1I0KAR8_9ACTN|nr:ATP-binding protein [Nonomuraea wenchangensis]SEU21265.1 AAA ATPase domain-containing protein [Nonomuraea wenchangensis]
MFVERTAFVGRTAELALLHAELRAAIAGHARTVVIDGPEGIGKTALVRRWPRRRRWGSDGSCLSCWPPARRPSPPWAGTRRPWCTRVPP